ncbi:MAG: hypothetical protein OXN88_09120 [Chloroflexota bacterium]|nr:hypothetical protein [Chloroflexota bacterium]
MTDYATETIKEIKNLKRKSALQQHCHFELANRVNVSSKVLNVLLILLSGLTMLSTTAHADILLTDVVDELTKRRVSALFSVALFLLMLLRLELRLADIVLAFKSSGDAHTRFLRSIDMQLTTLDSLTNTEAVKLGEQLTREYSAVVDSAREIPSNHLLRLKQKFLQQKKMSKRLDEDPFQDLKEMRKRLQRESGRN